MDLTEGAFDETIAAADTSMVIVAARAGDDVDACLVGFHCQCSIEPLRYAVWLSKANRTCQIASRTRTLRVHWLARDQVGLAERAGGQSLDRHPDKMQDLPWHPGAGGTVVLDEAAGSFGGTIVGTHDDGDHVCFVLEPFDAKPAHGPVLRFSDVSHIRAGHDADPTVPPR